MMGRLVGTPRDAVWHVEIDYSVDCRYHECTKCGHAHYTGGDVPEQCEECGHSHADAVISFMTPKWDDNLSVWHWGEFKRDIKDALTQAFPSLSLCDKWLRQGGRAILENRYAYIGVAGYCERASIWCVAKDCDENGYGWETHGLAEQWARSIEKRAERLLKPLSHHPADWAKAA